MAKVTFTDIIALAKAGYTPQNVKELMTLDASEQNNPGNTQTETKAEADTTNSDISQSSAPAAPVNASSPEPKESTKAEAEPDYKALYEAEKEKVNALQNKNNQADISGKNTNDVDLVDLVRSFT